jgi:hypothetical protein
MGMKTWLQWLQYLPRLSRLPLLPWLENGRKDFHEIVTKVIALKALPKAKFVIVWNRSYKRDGRLAWRNGRMILRDDVIIDSSSWRRRDKVIIVTCVYRVAMVCFGWHDYKDCRGYHGYHSCRGCRDCNGCYTTPFLPLLARLTFY